MCQPPSKTRKDGHIVRPSVRVLDGVWNERTDRQTDAGNRICCICDICMVAI